ncbi:hypothetical protein CHS0354_037525 [Potamilus streckersoni]|uniref:Pleckstrin homology domain-containing family A member 8 n=1 Tax=Potamilus streckersoni TaxID=2493646 RepID=A0AAE0VHS6_9BIVA|nr:hypothetical protein CHS0354_037525 [Potamilus streckersoni]
MEGVLWKWTNYLSGWQPRWFVLDGGILSYYNSEQDVNNGCKGSLRMAVCDIRVHQTDNTRLDLIIPGEQHFYVKTATPHERQQWLIELGSAKASLSSGRSDEDSGKISPDIVRSKKSELRLYCDVLMQQVHSVKMAVQEKEVPDIQGSKHQINRSSSMDKSLPMRVSRSPSVSSIENTPPMQKSSRKRTVSNNSYSDQSLSESENVKGINRTTSTIHENSSTLQETTNTNGNQSMSQDHAQSQDNHMSADSSSQNQVQSKPVIPPSGSSGNVSSGQVASPHGVKQSNEDVTISDGDVFLDAVDTKIPTFFSVMKPSFMDIQLKSDGGIPTESYLGACKSLVPIFDKLNATAFAPVKMDFQGNIRKMHQKYITNSAEFTTLQQIVISEIKAKQHQNPNSATVALLWMKRGLQFVSIFMQELVKGEQDLGTAVSKAYTGSLKPYHGWVVRGVFAVAVKALPYRSTFLSLLKDQNGKEIEDEELFLQSLLSDMDAYVTAMDVLIKILSDFYKKQGLDTDEKI